MKTAIILIQLLLIWICSEAAIKTITINSEEEINHDPVYVDLSPGSIDPHVPLCLKKDGGDKTAGQIEKLDDGTQRLWWIASLPENSTASYDLVTDQNCNSSGGFYWERVRDDATRLMVGKRPVIQYEHPVYDTDDVDNTNKPFHHVFDPAGMGLITKGPGGQYPHHRGIFIGYYLFTGEDRVEKAKNNTDRINIWSSSQGERAEHYRVIREFSGPVMGGHVLELFWIDRDENTLIREIRELRAFKQPRGEALIDFSSKLRPTAGPVKLWGDPHHGGVQFRAAQYVADNPESTIFIRPEHWSHLAPDQENQGRRNPENLHITPWDAMHFTIRDRTFTAAQLTHPDNPGESQMGERKYGRFGYYFPHDLTDENPLDLKYRFWITAGEAPERLDIDKKYNTFASPPAPHFID